ncbi:uncharacterized protein LOC144372061 isoform X1 [Ictidomys tridecemlineatus]
MWALRCLDADPCPASPSCGILLLGLLLLEPTSTPGTLNHRRLFFQRPRSPESRCAGPAPAAGTGGSSCPAQLQWPVPVALGPPELGYSLGQPPSAPLDTLINFLQSQESLSTWGQRSPLKVLASSSTTLGTKRFQIRP